MEDNTENPTAVKVEEHSQCVIFTYFHGDIGTMVDSHFSRALNKPCKAKAPGAKLKKTHQPIKLEQTSACQESAAESYSPLPIPPGRHQVFSPPDGPSRPWHPINARIGQSPSLSAIAYNLPPDGLSLTGQQCATSLLNLLHSDRGDIGSGMASGSKPDLLPNWMVPPGLTDSVDPAVGFESGRHMDKKDLYWY
ncbi:transcription cofactor vestigial-like protein 1 [Synchiropus splendidus]|uniref:transcription cofactor vestigial-like protein 1 n=1 Tax=Synchiropus splendidus TaxID=270530 RepID=UPI00237D756E|nr:transcription cofactor vestigial-like protein 1 [Synchiropus splendidus]XP_053735519.1 transcription cofactor vestigial-like protein 1 [Synchiropus splendidus]